MKALHFFAAPYLSIAAFLLILISGEMLGGPYLLYLLLALPHGGIHSLLAVGGVVCLLLAHLQFTWSTGGGFKLSGYIVGIMLLAASLFSFFYNDTAGYNNSTFEQAVPLASMVLAGMLGVLFLVLNIARYFKASDRGRASVANGA